MARIGGPDKVPVIMTWNLKNFFRPETSTVPGRNRLHREFAGRRDEN